MAGAGQAGCKASAPRGPAGFWAGRGWVGERHKTWTLWVVDFNPAVQRGGAFGGPDRVVFDHSPYAAPIVCKGCRASSVSGHPGPRGPGGNLGFSSGLGLVL